MISFSHTNRLSLYGFFCLNSVTKILRGVLDISYCGNTKTWMNYCACWDHPPLAAAMTEAGFEDIGTYVTRRQNTVAQYIVTRPILDLCDWYAWRTGVWVSQRWWEQDRFYLERAKERSSTESDGEEAQSEEEGLAK